MFEGQAPGCGDAVVLYILCAIAGYYAAWKRSSGRTHRLRPQLGFIVTSAAVWGLGLVHALKWAVGRARPMEVLYSGEPFTAWYRIGPHFVTEGVYRGSFPSGHTAQAALLLTLVYVIAAAARQRPPLRQASWGAGAFCLFYVAGMGAARVMALSHWLTDVVAGLFMTWLGIHITYHWLLQVPAQTAFYRKTGRWPRAPEAWELRLSAWLLGVLAGAAAAALGARALLRSDHQGLGFLLPIGAVLLTVSLLRARSLRQRALAELEEPAP
jgi:membrane-associated phospholipid phosphatase